jgi:transcriptional regulator with XRE-family HTH domain
MPQRQWTGERHWLRELRGNRSLREIGEPHGFASGALSGFEQGRGVPTLETLPRLAAAYGMDPAAMAARFLAEIEEYHRRQRFQRPVCNA